MFNTISNWIEAKHHALAARAIDVWVQKKGQGTTEYAILVGVLVVIAIIAITLFRPKIQELWDAISSGIKVRLSLRELNHGIQQQQDHPQLRPSQKISGQHASMRTGQNDRSAKSHFAA